MKLEFDAYGNHRLVAEDGRVTRWARYTELTYLDGKVGMSAYWGPDEAIRTPDEALKLMAVCEALTEEDKESLGRSW